MDRFVAGRLVATGSIAVALGVGAALSGPATAAAGPADESSSPGASSPGASTDTQNSSPTSRTPRGRAATRPTGPGKSDRTNRQKPTDVASAGSTGTTPAAAAVRPAAPAAAQSAVPSIGPVRSASASAAASAAAQPVAAPASAAQPAGTVAVTVPAPAAATPTAITAPAAGTVKGLVASVLARLFGSGPGLADSPLSWTVLAASRRAARFAGQMPAAATTTTSAGVTTTVTWAWGSNPVLAFNPATDKLDFGWMQASQFDVTEKSGSTVISVVDNNHTYTLQNVAVGQLSMSNIVAKDTSTVSKWQGLIANAQNTQPAVSIASAAVTEGNSGTTNAVLAVTLSKPSTKTVTVAYRTADGTATAGQDYTAATGTVTFAPGVTAQQVTVKVAGDTTYEPDETFTVTLSNASGASLGTATGTVTIKNDDAAPVTPPTISIANAAVAEGNSGTTNMAFTVSLSKASSTAVSVGYSTANGTATAGQDYTAASGTLTFAPGTTTQQVNVAVIGDTAVEPDETFTVTLANPVGATLTTATATGTITNDDAVTPPPVTGDRWGKAFYAPYVDMGGWPVPDLLAISQTNGGGSLFTAAFMQATPDGKLAWAGLNALTPDATNDQALAINKSIKALQAAGGDVMISLGGQAGTSLAQWGSANGMTAQQLANAYGGIIDTYGITHLDFDIEGAAVADPASIALNAQALKLLQQSKPQVQVWYTLPVLPTGLTSDGIKVVDAALKAGVTLAGVNVMAMDYGESAAPTSGAAAKTMGAYAIQSAESTYSQLTTLYSGYGKSFGYSQLGVTPMLGVNDITSEVFTLADAQALEDYARAKGVGMLALWSVTRDTPGQLGVSTYTHSGMSAPAGSFAKIFNDYGTTNTLNYGSSGGGGGTPPVVTGGTTTAVGWHWGTNTALAFNPAADKLDFGWMQPTSFDISEKSGSTIITIVGNNQTYTLTGVTLSSLSTGNIVALDATTLAKWGAAIAAAKQQTL
jgi:hypothetical protein